MKITATNKATGELIELPADTPEEIVGAWRAAQEYEKAAKALKDQLKKLVPELVGDNTMSEPIGNYAFRVSHIQRMNYDISVMREVLDPDLFDTMLKPDKPVVDGYIKEHLEEMGDAAAQLRRTMIEEGKPYQVIKLEKLVRD